MPNAVTPPSSPVTVSVTVSPTLYVNLSGLTESVVALAAQQGTVARIAAQSCRSMGSPPRRLPLVDNQGTAKVKRGLCEGQPRGRAQPPTTLRQPAKPIRPAITSRPVPGSGIIARRKPMLVFSIPGLALPAPAAAARSV